MKKITIILGIVFVQLSLFAQIPTDSLVLYLPFNGNSIDESGNGNNGTVNGATLTEDRFGNPNSAYLFSGNMEKITIPNSQSLNFSNNQSFSINVWIKINETQQISGVITKSVPDGLPVNEKKGWQLLIRDDKFNTEFHKTATEYCQPTVNKILSHIDWYMLTFIIDRNNSKITYYINAIQVLDSISNVYSSADMTNTYDLYIGADRTLNSSYYFKGSIDDIRIYKKALTPCEVRALYFEGEPTNCSVYDTISVTDTLIIDAVLSGINPPNNINTIKIYPNPAKTHIYIDNGNYNLMNGYSIKIDNSLGQTVYNHLIDQQEFYIDLSGWTGNGTYFVYIIDDNSNIIEVKKIILQ